MTGRHAAGRATAIRPAATVAVLRDSADGLEVLLLRRTHRAVFVPGAYVFPGGAVDPLDDGPDLAAVCDDPGVADRAARVAAARETFEEAGLLLGNAGPGPDADVLAEHRAAVLAGTRTLVEVCADLDVRLAVSALRPFGRWVTPPGGPRRYDTRFFAIAAPPGQSARHDDGEMVDSRWYRPADALAAADRGELDLIRPTEHTLGVLARFASAADVLGALDAADADPGSWLVVDDPATAIDGGAGRRPRLGFDAATEAEIAVDEKIGGVA